MRLRVWIPPLAELRNDALVTFEVLDKGRQVQHRDASTINALPKGVDCELILHPVDVVLLEIRPPRLRGSKLAAALPSLVEERLVGDIEDVHVVATPVAGDGTAIAAVVDRAMLRRTLDLFARQKRRVLAVVPNPFALSYDPQRWRVRVRDGAGSVRSGPASGVTFSQSEEVPIELQLLVKHASSPPSELEVDGDCDTHAWSRSLGINVRQVSPEARAAPVALDLMQYQFSPGVGDLQGWRIPAVLGFVLLLVTLVGLNAHALKLNSDELALREQMVAIAQEVIPGVSVVLDPVAQVQQRVEQLRSGAGINNAEFLALTQAMGKIVDVDSVLSMEYRNRTLNVEFVANGIDANERRDEIVSRGADVGLDIRFMDGRATVRRRGSE